MVPHRAHLFTFYLWYTSFSCSTALSGVFNCLIEVYENSENPKVRQSPNISGNLGAPLRLFYKNNHYSIIRSDGLGEQLFIFEGLEPGELQEQKVRLSKAKEIQNCIESVQDPSLIDPNLKQAIEQSKAIKEAFNKYLRFYASRIMR